MRAGRPAVALVASLIALAAGSSGRGPVAAPAAPSTFAAVIPKPVSAVPAQGVFVLGRDARIVVRPRAADTLRVARYLAGVLNRATGYAVAVSDSASADTGDIALTLDPAARSLGAEGYRLSITTGSVALAARRTAGLFWGIQTLRQLLPPAIESSTVVPGPWLIPAGTIRDYPRFEWRGAMLDVARHFFPPREVKRFIALMAAYKLNRLHLHLSDDQGWRLAIRSWPRLAAYGGRTEVGGGAGGYYTQKEYADIVAYAAARHIVVVPEIDMPAHVGAALASYPALACSGVAPPVSTSLTPPVSSLCVGKPLTYSFVEDVVRELASLTPGPYIHVGGDEASGTKPADYVRFVERVQAIVRRHRKRLIGWEEVARAKLLPTSIAQHWHDDMARRAVAQHAKVIMSPATKAYMDMKYDPSTPLGTKWAGYTNVRDAYSWNPATTVPGVHERDVLGVEAPLWTETVASRADIDYMVFPRLLGYAEIGWSKASGRSWSEYRVRLGAQGPRFRELGVDAYPAPGIPWR